MNYFVNNCFVILKVAQETYSLMRTVRVYGTEKQEFKRCNLFPKVFPFLDFFWLKILRYWLSRTGLIIAKLLFDMDFLPFCGAKVQSLASEISGYKFETECCVWYLELELQHSIPCNSGSSKYNPWFT